MVLNCACLLVRYAYNLLLAALAPVAIPYWAIRSIARGHTWKAVLEGLGLVRLPIDSTPGPSVWFHAVSVGEVQSSLPLLRSLRQSMPTVPIYLTTGTPTGRQLAEEQVDGVVTAVYRAPIDLPWAVATVLSRLQPRLLVVAETELWPNYFLETSRRDIPAMIVNGRISDRSAPRYRRLRFLFRHVLNGVDTILAQSETDRRRFVDAGARPSCTVVSPNLKYDFDATARTQNLSPVLAQTLLELSPSFVVVAGSTRESEESMLVPSLREIAERVPKCLLVVAPRHPKRFETAAETLRATSLPVYRRSQLPASEEIELPAILVLDSLGELAALYGHADLVFVGGSLNGWGGHNVLEPVLFRKPVVVGPHMQNFRQIASDLRRVGGLVEVDGPDGLREKLLELAESPAERDSIGRAGLEFARAQRGAAKIASGKAVELYRQASPTRRPGIIRRICLGIPAAAWSGLARLRRHAYARGSIATRALDVPVLSVGNLVAGGTGKTPTTAWLVERLWDHRLVVGVLTRGYGRRRPNRLRLLKAGDSVDSREVGDEPAMLAEKFASTAPQTRFGIHPDRFLAGTALRRDGHVDCFVLDDGFQHIQLRRTVNIVLLDGEAPFGNGYTLPLGRLREPPASLRNADLVLLTRCEPTVDYGAARALVARENPRAAVFHSRMAVTYLVDLGTRRSTEPELLANKRVAAFCGIGNPESFFRQLGRIGYRSVYRRSFRDHYRYTARDVADLRAAAAKARAEAIVTTAKDAMNLTGRLDFGLPAYALGIELEVNESEELIARVLDAMGSGMDGLKIDP